MSKPDLPGGQNLEEILASIRKTLADDRPVEGLSKLDGMEAAGGADPVAPVNGGEPHDGDTLPDRLADALNGHADEEDLTDLLASELPTSAQTPKPQAEGRDPLWFLSRAPASAGINAKPAVAHEPDELRAPAQPEEIALTRPETLRRSFPPLFGGGEATPARPADVPFDRVKPAEALGSTPARAPEALVVPTPATVPADKPAVSYATAAKPAAEAAKPAAAVETGLRPAAVEPRTGVEPVRAEPEPAAEVAAIAVAPDIPAPEPQAEPQAEPDAEPGAGGPETAADAAKAEPAAGQQTEPLQEVIARLLEPVIQQWLDANLPRMVEDAIREEVARQVKGPRRELKI